MKPSRRGAAVLIITALVLLASAPGNAAGKPNPSVKHYQSPVFSTVKVTRDVQYGNANGLANSRVRLRLDLYEPAGDWAPRRPALIWAHGGAFQGGDKTDEVATTLAVLFAKLGYVTASINYRTLAPPSGCDTANLTSTCFNAAVAAGDDAKAAVRWLRAHATRYRLDGNRIAIGGESAGGIIATEVGTTADRPGNSGNPRFPSRVAAWISISGGVPGGQLVDRTDAPGLLFSFVSDATVPAAWSVQTAKAMRRAGVWVRLETLPGSGHVDWDQYHARYERGSITFLYQYLRLAQLDRAHYQTPGPAQCYETRINADLGATSWHERLVVGGYGAPSPGCENNYALVDSCPPAEKGECGDSLSLVRFVDNRWRQYISLPNPVTCYSQAVRDGVPTRWRDLSGWFPNC